MQTRLQVPDFYFEVNESSLPLGEDKKHSVVQVFTSHITTPPTTVRPGAILPRGL